MASSNNEMATPVSRDERQSRRVNGCNQRWEGIKSDIFRKYIEEDKDLYETMALIQEIHNFKARPRSWKSKLKKWGYNKNLTGDEMRFVVAKQRKRALEGKDTTFLLHGGTEITPQRIENFKRRRTGEAPPTVATPSNITYHTPPGLSNGGDSLDEICEEFIPYHPPLSHMSSFSVLAQASSAGSLCSEIRSSHTAKADLTEVPPMSMLNQYVSDEIQPWSAYNLLHQLGDHDAVLFEHKQMLTQIADLVTLPEEQNSLLVDLSDEQRSSPELFCFGDQFLVDSCPTLEYQQGDGIFKQAAFKDLFGLAVTLAEYQSKYEEFSTLTLVQEFKLAKVLERSGWNEEAEYHCRRILDRDPQIDVQSLLGMILANTSRFEESTFLLFSAITSFIVEFNVTSIEANRLRFPPINLLFIELVEKSEEDVWDPLSQCMCEMMDTIQNAVSEGTVNQIFPRLLIYGFSLAHQCLVLEFIDSAKYMYQVLLHHSSHLDAIIYGIEKARAYREYGHLLRREKRWTSSAEQLFLACKSAMDSGTHDSGLIQLLKSDHIALFPYLAAEFEEDSVIERIREILARFQRQSSPHMQGTSTAVQHSRVAEFLLSPDSPMHFVARTPSTVSHVAQFGLSSSAADLARGDADRTSTTSVSGSLSYKIAMTVTDTVVSGISDSIFMAA